MSSEKTNVRAEISKKKDWYIPKNRYYELKHFCLQYLEWERKYAALDSLSKQPTELEKVGKTNNIPDPVADCAEKMEFYMGRMRMVEDTAKIATGTGGKEDNCIWRIMVVAVTRERPYEWLVDHYTMPMGRDKWYELYRCFFWHLDKARK